MFSAPGDVDASLCGRRQSDVNVSTSPYVSQQVALRRTFPPQRVDSAAMCGLLSGSGSWREAGGALLASRPLLAHCCPLSSLPPPRSNSPRIWGCRRWGKSSGRWSPASSEAAEMTETWCLKFELKNKSEKLTSQRPGGDEGGKTSGWIQEERGKCRH